jgi:solute carrier family 50 protein (sugar transporter)
VIVGVVSAIGPAIGCGVHVDDDSCNTFTTLWLGTVMTIIYALLYCGQLTSLKEVLKTKNSASISPWLTAGVLFCASVWTFYAILVVDYFYLTSSSIGIASAITQIILIMIYPAKWNFTDNETPVQQNEIIAATPEFIPENETTTRNNSDDTNGKLSAN